MGRWNSFDLGQLNRGAEVRPDLLVIAQDKGQESVAVADWCQPDAKCLRAGGASEAFLSKLSGEWD